MVHFCLMATKPTGLKNYKLFGDLLMFVSGMGKTATYIRYSFENIYIYTCTYMFQVSGDLFLVHLEFKQKWAFMKGCSHRPALCLDDEKPCQPPSKGYVGYVIGNQMEGISSTKGSSNCHHYREQPDFASASGKHSRGNKGRFFKGLVRDNDGEFPMILKQFASWWRFYPPI